jgi:hypothetical protein
MTFNVHFGLRQVDIIFEHLDSNGDGAIAIGEFEAFVRKFGDEDRAGEVRLRPPRPRARASRPLAVFM